MDLLMLSLLLGAAVLFLVYCLKDYNYWGKHGIPTAKGRFPVFGNMLDVVLFKCNYSDLCRKIYAESKGRSMVGLYNMGTPTLLIREPGLVKTVMQIDFSSFHQNAMKIDPQLDPLLADNPFFADGEIWMAGRKRLTYAFSSMRLKILFETVTRVCKKLEAYLDRKIEQSKGRYEVELKDLFSRYTAEVVANAGFGVEGFAFEDKFHPASFHVMGKELFEPTLLSGIRQVLLFVLPMLNKIFRTSFVPEKVDRFFRNIVKDIMANRRQESVKRNDFFQLMMDLEKKEGERFDEKGLTTHAFSFFLDGYETSSITLSLAAYQLATHPRIQQRLRDDVRAVLDRHDGAMVYESLKEMTYMDQVVQESQRFYPALGNLGKECTREFELKGSDGLHCRVKPGTQIVISTHGLQMDPEHWANPAIFDPDRFGEDKKKEIEKFAFLPFGEGPRMCVGMRMALVMMKACLATVTNKYTLELSSRTQVPLKFSARHFLSSPIGGIWVNIKHV